MAIGRIKEIVLNKQSHRPWHKPLACGGRKAPPLARDEDDAPKPFREKKKNSRNAICDATCLLRPSQLVLQGGSREIKQESLQ